MPFKVDWYIPKRVIHVQYLGDFANEDLAPLKDTVERLLEAGDAPIYYLADILHLDRMSANPLTNRESFSYATHPKLDYAVLCGSLNRVASFFASVISQLVGVQFKQVATLEEAIDFLKRRDPSL